LTGSSDNTVKLWDLNGTENQSFKAHSATIYAIAISPDDKSILTGSKDNTARLWDIDKINIDSVRRALLSDTPPLTFYEKLTYNTIELDEVLTAKENQLVMDGCRIPLILRMASQLK